MAASGAAGALRPAVAWGALVLLGHTGDGIMASFASVPDAVECARAIQRALEAHNDASPDDAMHLRIGISAGEPIEEDGDLFGHAVQLAARVCAHAEPGCILVSDVVREQCPGKEDAFASRGTITPKGFGREVPVHEVLWKE